jgi:DNA-binding MurR/RpiR family transcriptional regulator
MSTTNRHETFDALRARIRARHDDLSPHLQRIARSALEDPNGFALRTIAAIADSAQVQPSALIRFAKELGYNGFSSMQQVFKLRLIEGASMYREQVYEAHAEGADAADPMHVLTECVDDMVSSLEHLKRTVDPAALARAIDMLRRAKHIYVAGLRRSRPIAAYLAYGLMRVERPCSLLDFDGGMASQQVANMRPGDMLAAAAFAEYSPPVVDAVRDAHLRGIAVLAITDTPASPLARNSMLTFLFDETPTAPFRPISGPIALVQTLVVSLSAS